MSTPGHICLVGSALCRNWRLVERLGERHGLTLLPRLARSDMPVMVQAAVVAVDCREVGAAAVRQLVDDLTGVTGAAIVVMDGGLRRDEIAWLLGAGARDYFSEPFNVSLIAERLEHLAVRAVGGVDDSAGDDDGS